MSAIKSPQSLKIYCVGIPQYLFAKVNINKTKNDHNVKYAGKRIPNGCKSIITVNSNVVLAKNTKM